MKITQILGINVDPETEDALDMVLSARYSRMESARTPEQKEQMEERDILIREMARKYYPDGEDCEKFLDMAAMCESGEKEDAYLCGIRDGIRFCKVVGQI